MFHVAVIVAAYGFFGISFLLGIVNMLLMIFSPKVSKKLIKRDNVQAKNSNSKNEESIFSNETVKLQTEKSQLRIKELSIINNMSLMVGLALMTIGTFLGAIWANESWGRYWGWDPKET